MPRTYTKRNSEYWDNRTAAKTTPSLPPITIQNVPAVASAPSVNPNPFPEINYGSEFYEKTPTQVAYASNPTAAPSVVYRERQQNDGTADYYAFQNIRALPSALVNYLGNRDYVGVKNAIDLCIRAYGGVPVLRNAIEVSVEFSNQPLWIKCENQTVKTFFQEWFEALQMNKLKEQFFREYYRSGNVFLYKFDGKFGPAYYKNMQQSFAIKENRIPIRYELLNPSNVFVPTGLTFPHTYARLLSMYDIERLKNPLTEQDRQVFNSLPDQVKSQLKGNTINPYGVWIPLDPKRLRFAFYKKQGYEPMAIPMAYPVLPSIEWKLALTKMDVGLSRTLERAILLITTGEGPNQYNGGNGINQNNIGRLQSLFNNQTIARTLVADYTTKGEWLIPEIQDILGPQKYEVVDRDIREGLQSILMGDDKFANAQIKAKVFIQRLVEGQNIFLNDFLLPEIKMVCDAMGFRTMPKVGFQKINLSDEIVFARIVTQMAQLGLLTADEANTALQTGVLPDKQESQQNQEEYKKLRDKGLYAPLTGGAGAGGGGSNPNGRPGGTTGIKQTTKQVSPQGTTRASEGFSIKSYTEGLRAGEQLVNTVAKAMQKKFKVKVLNDEQNKVVQTFAKAIMSIYPIEEWSTSVASFIKKPSQIPDAVANEVDEIMQQYDVDSWDATVLRHCKISVAGLVPQDNAKILEKKMQELAQKVEEIPKAQASAKLQDIEKKIDNLINEDKKVEAMASADKLHHLTIELKQPASEPKQVSIVKTQNGFELKEIKKD